MVANDAGRDVPRAAVTPSLVVAALMAVYLGVMMGSYLDGPSVQGALDSYAVQNDKSQHGLTYTFLYQDTDGAGRVRYHFVSDGGGNIPLAITCEFHWFGRWGIFERRDAGWNYICSNSEEWLHAYDAWELSPGYDGPRRHLFDRQP